MPSFHILTSEGDALNRSRGPKMNNFLSIIRGNQDIMGMFVLGGVFEKHPRLKIVCVEADAGWVPHFMYRMDHAWKRHRKWLTANIDKLPSEYFREHIYTDVPGRLRGLRHRRPDELAPAVLGQRLPALRLDLAVEPGDARPSRPISLTDEQRRAILCDNTAELYGIDTSTLPVGRRHPRGLGRVADIRPRPRSRHPASAA